MSFLISLALAGAAQLSDQYRREWQSCIIDTSRLWAAKPGPSDRIVDAAPIYCRGKLDSLMIVHGDEAKKIGLTQAQAEEYNSFLVASLLRITRGFAIDAVEKARGK